MYEYSLYSHSGLWGYDPEVKSLYKTMTPNNLTTQHLVLQLLQSPNIRAPIPLGWPQSLCRREICIASLPQRKKKKGWMALSGGWKGSLGEGQDDRGERVMSNKERGERDNVICIERPTAKDTKKIYLFWQGKSNIADCSLALSLS